MNSESHLKTQHMFNQCSVIMIHFLSNRIAPVVLHVFGLCIQTHANVDIKQTPSHCTDNQCVSRECYRKMEREVKATPRI